ncbi:MAG TPA: hypothetical protein VK162_12470 [Streptosporangiaceae bacterium]|nr:hypothetical protein [Streptosporangiaceae bacterium]
MEKRERSGVALGAISFGAVGTVRASTVPPRASPGAAAALENSAASPG